MTFRYVFEIKVRPGKDEKFIEHWRKVSEPIQEYSGARGTRLYKKRGDDHVYIAIAEWESIDARKAAMNDIFNGKSVRAKRVKEWGNNEDFGKVTVIGELDEIDKALPPNDKHNY